MQRILCKIRNTVNMEITIEDEEIRVVSVVTST